ncbi:MAG: BACON domain-containing protein [Muribaculaceae bacterium]|nr:BACON domain-containing protein [Muribaculaceae bacterium]
MKIFRKRYGWLLASEVLVLLAGCGEKSGGLDYSGSTTARSLKVSLSNFNYSDASARTDYFTVESVNASWALTDYADWISLAPSSGSKTEQVTMNVKANSTADPRTSIFYLKSTTEDYNFQTTLSVTQAGVEPFLTVDKEEVTFGASASSQTVKVSSNFTWSVLVDKDWVTATKSENGETLNITVSENPENVYRSATISLKQENKTFAVITVGQFPAEINVSNGTVTFGNEASQTTITVTSETSWTAAVSDSWIQVNPSEGGAGVTTVTIEVAQNGTVDQRTGFVSIRTGNQERLQIEIIQKGNYLDAESELKFYSREESKTVNISSNLNWEVTSMPEWLSVTPLSGRGNGEITVTVSENVSTNQRSGAIVITSPGLTISTSINVTQLGKTLTPSTTYLEFGDKGGEQQFEIISDGAWSSSASASWFSATPLSGAGDALITVSVEENNAESERSGTIKYTFGEKETDVYIYQKGKYFNIEAQDFTFPSAGGTHSIELGTNERWTATVEGNPSWLTLSATSGEGEAIIEAVATPNNTLEDRKAVIIITPQSSQAVRISVLQKGKYMTVSTQSLSFYSKGGESQPITIDTDGEFSISNSVNWLTINMLSDNIFTVYAQPNNQPEIRNSEIIIRLEGLSQGRFEISIPVSQVGEGGSFVLEGYPSDSDWDNFTAGGLSISINGFSADQDWNVKSGNTFSVKIEPYSNEENWN